MNTRHNDPEQIHTTIITSSRTTLVTIMTKCATQQNNTKHIASVVVESVALSVVVESVMLCVTMVICYNTES